MNKVGCLTVLVFCIVPFSEIFSQSFPEFDSLKHKAYAAYDNKDYASSLSYFEKILQLAEDRKPGLDGTFYYDVACSYSLIHDINKSLVFLERSFAVARSRNENNPVGINHIASDTDLDFVRADSRFKDFLKRYYSQKDFDLYLKRDAFNKIKEISYSSLLEYIQSPEGPLEIKDKVIYWEKSGDSMIYNKSALPIPKIDRAKTEGIYFINCTFRLNFVWDGPRPERGQAATFYALGFDNCHFIGRFSINEITIKGRGELRITKCIFDKTFLAMPRIDLEETWGGCFISKCTFHLASVYLNSSSPTNFYFYDNELLENLYLDGKSIATAAISGNRCERSIFKIWLIDVDIFKILENKLYNVIINANVGSEFDFEKNTISKNVIFDNTYFPESVANDIDWSTLSHGHLALIAKHSSGLQWDTPTGKLEENGDPRGLKLLTGESPEDISDESNFRHLTGLYSMFLNLYKSKSDIESFNSCFVAIKELQSKRLEYLYQSNKTFKTFFRWKLTQLLKFYVNHGTDPAQAIVISLYIIFWFGIFFFFFPSDWDTTSKKNLIQNFKDFIQKNEKGYVIPFFVLIGGFALSLINALTLSLNAFITLGFGNIPTHGLARYVCVIEGFMGWFLLSIFTVALINQVL